MLNDLTKNPWPGKTPNAYGHEADLSVFKKMLTAIERPEQSYKCDAQIKTIKIFFRNNPDGTPRWIWPSGLKRPVFLRFYNTSSLRAKQLSIAIRLLFAFRLQHFFASGKMEVSMRTEDYQAFLQVAGSEWSLFTGTVGVNRTALFYANHNFYKIAVGASAPEILVHEFNQINRWKFTAFKTLELPKVNFNNAVMRQTDVAAKATRVGHLTKVHWLALEELSGLNQCRARIGSLPFWQETTGKLDRLQRSTDRRLPQALIKKLTQLHALIDADKTITVCYQHGDFTAWNMFLKKDQLALIDFELARESMPCLFDAFHFLYQQSSLVDHHRYSELKSIMHDAFTGSVAKRIIQNTRSNVELNHQLYLLFTIAYYLDVYTRQPYWPTQVKMSLACWNDALNDVIKTRALATERQLLLTDVFDFLADKKYAALKWLNSDPASVPVNSDIDLCVTESLRRQLKIYLQQHPYVMRCSEKRKSFMSTFSIITHDGGFLSLDAIVAFKRRHTVMLDAKKLLSSVVTNAHGIKVPSPVEDFNYMWLFYILNNASIPNRYQKHFDQLSAGEQLELSRSFNWKNILGIDYYYEAYDFTPSIKQRVMTELNQIKTNKGWHKLVNRASYFADSFRDGFFQKGFTITFSGVDGAGKSTVIENVKYQIEKQYRRKVVVLRHRPSMLPMISGIKEGRLAAEQRSANSLPRQGKNNNLLSSLLRFAYYYTDYFFGQFLVQIKYVWRGYIVLYDRYYFDFINDGKRSNIILPAPFTKFLYGFLLKPSFNFFLYADADSILTRKKEMDKPTIVALTGKYLQLFRQLKRRHRSSQYIPIQNDVLGQTLDTILTHVKDKAL